MKWTKWTKMKIIWEHYGDLFEKSLMVAKIKPKERGQHWMKWINGLKEYGDTSGRQKTEDNGEWLSMGSQRDENGWTAEQQQ